jgi:hypothetical protein
MVGGLTLRRNVLIRAVMGSLAVRAGLRECKRRGLFYFILRDVAQAEFRFPANGRGLSCR